MKYLLLSFGMVLVAIGLLGVFSGRSETSLTGALLTVAGAIPVTGGAMLDRLGRAG
jgi:hypothetical protein